MLNASTLTAFASLLNVTLRGSVLCFLHVTPIAEMEVVQKNHVFKAWMLSCSSSLFSYSEIY